MQPIVQDILNNEDLIFAFLDSKNIKVLGSPVNGKRKNNYSDILKEKKTLNSE